MAIHPVKSYSGGFGKESGGTGGKGPIMRTDPKYLKLENLHIFVNNLNYL